jgi:transposase-like protein
VIPVIYSSRDDPEDKLRALKRSLQQQDSTAKGFGSSSSSSSSGGQQFQPGASGSGIGNSEVSLTEGDKKWRLEATAVEEWEVRADMQ